MQELIRQISIILRCRSINGHGPFSSMSMLKDLAYMTTTRLQQILLQSEEELMTKRSSELSSEEAAVASKPKKVIGNLKVQVQKVRMSPDAPTGCNISSIKRLVVNVESIRYRVFSMKSAVSLGCTTLRKIWFAPQHQFMDLSRARVWPMYKPALNI